MLVFDLAFKNLRTMLTTLNISFRSVKEAVDHNITYRYTYYKMYREWIISFKEL